MTARKFGQFFPALYKRKENGDSPPALANGTKNTDTRIAGRVLIRFWQNGEQRSYRHRLGQIASQSQCHEEHPNRQMNSGCLSLMGGWTQSGRLTQGQRSGVRDATIAPPAGSPPRMAVCLSDRELKYALSSSSVFAFESPSGAIMQ